MWRQLLRDRRIRTAVTTVCALIFNVAYACYNAVLGIQTGSVWFITSCIYHVLLGGMRCAVMTRHRHFTMKTCIPFGGILTVVSFTLGGMVYISIAQNLATVHSTIPMITIATYTFTKIAMAITENIRHKHPSPPMLAVQVLRLCEIAVSVFTMQQSMLVSFGGMRTRDMCILNLCTGTAVCLFVLGCSIYLIRKGVSSHEH